MYTIERYIKDTLCLTNSLVIKISDIAIVKNRDIYVTHGIKPSEDKHEWKYYLNLSGEKHFTNNDVYINIVEDNRRVLLNKENLDLYELTKIELQKYSDLYNGLIQQYPDEIDYIKGCINPIDIDKAIDAPDGGIIAYARYYIEDNELSLIRELNSEIESMVQRWYINNYRITDELYLSSYVASMYAVIPATIMKLRLNKVYTNEVHSFHLENFFRSNFDIWDNLKPFNMDTKIWLYNNLKYIGKHIGKNDIIKLLIDKLLTPNNIGIAIYEYNNTEPVLNNNANIYTTTYDKPDNNYLLRPLNDNYVLNKNEVISISTLTNSQLYNDKSIDGALNKNILDSIDSYSKNKLAKGYIVNQNTKTMDVDVGTIWKMYGSDETLLILDNWLYGIINNSFKAYATYKDPNNNKIYVLNAKQGLYLFYYLLGMLTYNKDVYIDNIKYTTAINNDIPVNDLIHNTFNSEFYKPVAETIKSFIPDKYPIINRIDDFKRYIDDIEDLAAKTWILDSNLNNAIISSNIKYTVLRMFKTGNYNISETDGYKTIGYILKEQGIDLEINDEYDVLLSIKYLFKLFTNKDIDMLEAFNKKTDNIIELFNKLTSYTTQIVTTINDKAPLYSPYSTIEPIHAPKGLINVTSAKILTPYELNYFYVRGHGNDFREGNSYFQYSYAPSSSICNEIKGYLYTKTIDDFLIENNSINIAVEVINTCPDMYAPNTDANANNMIDNTNYYQYVNTPNGINMDTIDTVLYADINNDFIINNMPNSGVEIQEHGVDMYTPNTDAKANNADSSAKLDSIKYVYVNDSKVIDTKTIAYSKDPNTEDDVVINTTPNTIIEIE